MTGNRLVACALASLAVLIAPAHSRALKPFTVAEEIGLAHFDVPFYAEPTLLSPNGRFIALQPAEHGLLKKNRVEDELRVYEVAALREFLRHPSAASAPNPVLDLRESTYRDGPIISQLQWLPDSSGVAFLLRTSRGSNRLETIALSQARPIPLSLSGQDVTTFDVRDSTHYAYAVFSPGGDLQAAGDRGQTAFEGTGHPLVDIMFPDSFLEQITNAGGINGLRSIVWAAVGGAPHAVISHQTGEPIEVYPLGRWLALSPDGHTLATALPLPDVPKSWVRVYLPPYPSYPYHMHAGRQNLEVSYSAGTMVSEYVLVDLRTGTAIPVNDAPTGFGNGWWWSIGPPAWSLDGSALLLPNAYPRPIGMNQSVTRPCAALFYPATRIIQCLKHLKPPHTKEGAAVHGFVLIGPLKFAGNRSDEVVMSFLRSVAEVHPPRAEHYIKSQTGHWHRAPASEVTAYHKESLDVSIRQGLNKAPTVVITSRITNRQRMVWDPNPQLKDVALGEAMVYHWKDATGRGWTGGLYEPPNFIKGRRYPLVIQTHGFPENEFRPSGMYPTSFAARALAASGMIVLQVPFCPTYDTPQEGLCNVAGYVGAVSQLASQGLIDPNRVGIVGFSRTVYHVLEALTISSFRFAAASVTDGDDFGYWQYLASLDEVHNVNAQDADAVIGAKPFASGLKIWLRQSPEFNMQAVKTPLLVVALGRGVSLLTMWEPYAVLRYLGKPVDLEVLNSDEHVLTNPAARIASQGGSVDWFRFWLEGYEDPNSSKTRWYRTWEKLCALQRAQHPGSSTSCVSRRNEHTQGANRIGLRASRAG